METLLFYFLSCMCTVYTSLSTYTQTAQTQSTLQTSFSSEAANTISRFNSYRAAMDFDEQFPPLGKKREESAAYSESQIRQTVIAIKETLGILDPSPTLIRDFTSTLFKPKDNNISICAQEGAVARIRGRPGKSSQRAHIGPPPLPHVPSLLFDGSDPSTYEMSGGVHAADEPSGRRGSASSNDHLVCADDDLATILEEMPHKLLNINALAQYGTLYQDPQRALSTLPDNFHTTVKGLKRAVHEVYGSHSNGRYEDEELISALLRRGGMPGASKVVYPEDLEPILRIGDKKVRPDQAHWNELWALREDIWGDSKVGREDGTDEMDVDDFEYDIGGTTWKFSLAR